MKNRFVTSALVLTLLIAPAFTFWEQGHVIQARIAYDILEKEAPGALNKATALLETLKQTKASRTKKEGDYPFVESSTYADDMKSRGGTWQSVWHYADTPYLDQGGSIEDFPQFQPDAENATSAIPQLIDWMLDSGDYKSGYVYTTVTSKNDNEEEAKSEALRLLIHYIGDIHQPLHASARVNSDYPKGDAGGNFVKLPSKQSAKNLHAVWDSLVYLGSERPKMPYSQNDWDDLGTRTQTMVQQYPCDSSDTTSIDADLWAKESHELTVSNVYEDVTPNQALSNSYIEKNQEAIQKKLVCGGQRLAATIKHIFGTANQEASPVSFLA